MRFQCTLHGYCPCRLPHSEICGSMDICSSPQLIAACHVLLRLLMPRHSPCALSSLTCLPLCPRQVVRESWFSLRIMQAFEILCEIVTLCPFQDSFPQFAPVRFPLSGSHVWDFALSDFLSYAKTLHVSLSGFLSVALLAFFSLFSFQGAHSSFSLEARSKHSFPLLSFPSQVTFGKK